jgi:hypothetical protein
MIFRSHNSVFQGASLGFNWHVRPHFARPDVEQDGVQLGMEISPHQQISQINCETNVLPNPLLTEISAHFQGVARRIGCPVGRNGGLVLAADGLSAATLLHAKQATITPYTCPLGLHDKACDQHSDQFMCRSHPLLVVKKMGLLGQCLQQGGLDISLS